MSTDARTDAEVIADLEDAFTRDAETGADLALLRGRLAERADDEDLLDVAFRTVDSPFGPLLVAASPAGVVRVAFEREGHDAVLRELAEAISPRVLQSDRRTDPVARQLGEYFDGRRREFDLPVDLQLVRGFRRAVITHLQQIPYGATESYATVALAAGSAGAVRAAGSACGHNPVPVVVPCHRVIRSDGSLGQYRGGAEMKAALLAMEGGR